MAFEMENPWNVENLEEFLYFCCPECDLKDQSKVEFLQHALEQHPKAKECVQQFNEFIIKEEENKDLNCFSENLNDPVYDYEGILKCEIKEEPNDQEMDTHLKHKNIKKSKLSKKSRDSLKITKNYKCEECDTSCPSISNLKRHCSNFHEKGSV